MYKYIVTIIYLLAILGGYGLGSLAARGQNATIASFSITDKGVLYNQLPPVYPDPITKARALEYLRYARATHYNLIVLGQTDDIVGDVQWQTEWVKRYEQIIQLIEEK